MANEKLWLSAWRRASQLWLQSLCQGGLGGGVRRQTPCYGYGDGAGATSRLSRFGHAVKRAVVVRHLFESVRSSSAPAVLHMETLSSCHAQRASSCAVLAVFCWREGGRRGTIGGRRRTVAWRCGGPRVRVRRGGEGRGGWRIARIRRECRACSGQGCAASGREAGRRWAVSRRMGGKCRRGGAILGAGRAKGRARRRVSRGAVCRREGGAGWREGWAGRRIHRRAGGRRERWRGRREGGRRWRIHRAGG